MIPVSLPISHFPFLFSFTMLSPRIVFRALALPALIYISSIPVVAIGWYDRYRWLDNPYHIAGGASMALMFWILLRAKAEWKKILETERLLSFGLLVGLTAVVAIFWEVYELLYDIVFQTQVQGSVRDNVTDLVLGLLGSAVAVWYLLQKIKRCV